MTTFRRFPVLATLRHEGLASATTPRVDSETLPTASKDGAEGREPIRPAVDNQGVVPSGVPVWVASKPTGRHHRWVETCDPARVRWSELAPPHDARASERPPQAPGPPTVRCG